MYDLMDGCLDVYLGGRIDWRVGGQVDGVIGTWMYVWVDGW